jgi:hypothetical protein
MLKAVDLRKCWGHVCRASLHTYPSFPLSKASWATGFRVYLTVKDIVKLVLLAIAFQMDQSACCLHAYSLRVIWMRGR